MFANKKTGWFPSRNKVYRGLGDRNKSAMSKSYFVQGVPTHMGL